MPVRRLLPRSVLLAIAAPVLLVIVGALTLRPLVKRSAHGIAQRAAQQHAAPAAAADAAVSHLHWRRVWTWPAGTALSGTPIPMRDGWVVAAADRRLVMLDRFGHVRWTTGLPIGEPVGSAAAAGDCVVAADNTGKMVACSSEDGSIAWQATLDLPLRHGPLAVRMGEVWQVVLLASSDGVLQGLDAKNGRKRWHSGPTNRSDGPPATDGRYIAYGNCDAALHIYEATNGTAVATIAAGADAQIAGGVCFRGDRLYAGTRAGSLVCADIRARSLAWQQRLANGEDFVTPVAAGGLVIGGNAEGEVAAFDALSGAPRWRVSAGNSVTALCPIGDAVFASAGGDLVGLRLRDGSEFARLPIGDRVVGPVTDGRLVVVADDGGNVIATMGE